MVDEGASEEERGAIVHGCVSYAFLSLVRKAKR